MDSTKIPITKNVLDTSIHYICTNNLKLSSCLRLSNNINSKYHFDNIKILLLTPEQDPPVFNNIVFHHNILSSGFHLAGDSPNPFSIYAEVSVHTRARSTPVIPYRYFSNIVFSGRRNLAEDCAPQFLTFSINIHLVPRIFRSQHRDIK